MSGAVVGLLARLVSQGLVVAGSLPRSTSPALVCITPALDIAAPIAVAVACLPATHPKKLSVLQSSSLSTPAMLKRLREKVSGKGSSEKLLQNVTQNVDPATIWSMGDQIGEGGVGTVYKVRGGTSSLKSIDGSSCLRLRVVYRRQLVLAIASQR